MKMLSMHRPLPSMEMATPESLSTEVNSMAGELAALVGVEDLGTAVALQGLCEGIGAEAGIKGVEEPPGEHAAGGPVHHRHQVQEALLDGNIGEVGRSTHGQAVRWRHP